MKQLSAVLGALAVASCLLVVRGSSSAGCALFAQCPQMLQPVCARNTKGFVETFASLCRMIQENCRHGEDYMVLDYNMCYMGPRKGFEGILES